MSATGGYLPHPLPRQLKSWVRVQHDNSEVLQHVKDKLPKYAKNRCILITY